MLSATDTPPTMRHRVDQTIRVMTLGAGIVTFLLFAVFQLL